jgi:hypothetical protein
MGRIEHMKIMVFLHGTVIMHSGGVGHSRADRVRQVREGEGSVYAFSTYVPVGDSAEKLRLWKNQGADIVYMSPHREPVEVEQDQSVLRRNGFPEGPIFFRHSHKSYGQIVSEVMPDILIEDDCESIGGEAETTYASIPAAIRPRVKHVLVKEFEGIDHLPDDLAALAGSEDLRLSAQPEE